MSPCIYFLFKGPKLIYIGKSKNVWARVITHKSTKDFNKVRIIDCPIEKLTHYEMRLIRYFMPPLNVVGTKEDTVVVRVKLKNVENVMRMNQCREQCCYDFRIGSQCYNNGCYIPIEKLNKEQQ